MHMLKSEFPDAKQQWLADDAVCINCYRHRALLVNHGAIVKSVKISSQEKGKIGDLLSMICLGI